MQYKHQLEVNEKIAERSKRDIGIMSVNYPGDKLAQEAFDVMMRRGWVPSREYLWGDPTRHSKAAWIVREKRNEEGSAYRLEVGRIVGELGSQLVWADDPFTALVAADEWAKKHGL